MAIDLREDLYSYPEDFFVHWKDDVISVRQLYRERKYRRCAILCSRLLEQAIHAVHKTFLHFYQAICYESLGHIAHDYSTNKIPLLEQARDAFMLASETLSTSDPDKINGDFTVFEGSPICATLEIAGFYGTPTPSSIYTTHTSQCVEVRQTLDDTNSMPSTVCRIAKTYSIPDFNVYSPCTDFQAKGSAQNVLDTDLLTPAQQTSSMHNHKKRLSRSLSSKHALAEELVPSPLFSRGPSSKKESRSNSPELCSPTKYHQLTQLALCKPLPPLPPSRPLPLLPFNHNPCFVRKGKRVVIVPKRKTALSTLISKFEGKGPFNDASTPYEEACGDTVAEIGSQPFGRTPVTERFNRISAVFADKADNGSGYQHNVSPQQNCLTHNVYTTDEGSATEEDDINSDKENIDPTSTSSPAKPQFPHLKSNNLKTYPFDPVTPCPRSRIRPKNLSASSDSTASTASTKLPIINQPSLPPPVAEPTGTSQSTYTNLLSTFPPLLTAHIQTVAHTITKIREIQQQHDVEKRLRFARTHGRYSSLPSSSSSPIRKMKPLHSFWSLQIVSTEEDRKGRAGGARGGDRDRGKDEAKRERIKRLKEQGWNVKKEKVGFKGVEYYEDLIRTVECESRDMVSATSMNRWDREWIDTARGKERDE